MADARLPSWHWAYVLFRLADGATHALIPLLPLLRFGLPAWSVAATIAAMNLVALPASFLWAGLMERQGGIGRRRLAVTGFAAATAALVVLGVAEGIVAFGVAALAFAAFGTATGPAASVLALESVPAAKWSDVTGRMARMTGTAYLVGIVAVTAWGLAGGLRTDLVMLLSAATCLGAAGWAWHAIAPAQGRRQVRATPGMGLRRFERPQWLPMRLRLWPRRPSWQLANGDPLRLLVVILATFTGSTVFFASYPGMMARDLGFGVGLVLLAQAPSQFVTPFVSPWSVAVGRRLGEVGAVGTSLAIRLVALAALLVGMQGAAPLWWLLPAHAVMGLGFSMLQVNGACLMARVHRAGKGQGLASYHAAVAAGSMLGSLLAFALAAGPAGVVYVVCGSLSVAGALLYLPLRRSTQFVARNEVNPEAAG